MKNSVLYYSVGALLYCPADKESLADSIQKEAFGRQYSLALCLEDTIAAGHLKQAEDTLCHTLSQLHLAREKQVFYLPKIFVRVRNEQQITALCSRLGEAFDVVAGFILPKFHLANADSYLETIAAQNAKAQRPIYLMPIYESASLIDLRTRADTLYHLKDKLAPLENLVLNIRVGGNDLCHTFGFRRRFDEPIYRILPVAQILSDIVTVYGQDYVISGPVWEYYNGAGWEEGLRAELREDILCGFTGKTVIHPRQIAVVNDAYQVSGDDFQSAKAILDWKADDLTLVSSDPSGNRMNEYNTHTNWARNILLRAAYYGVR